MPVSRRRPPATTGPAELLSALLDGELDETTAAAVTVHVQECAECSRDWAELQATKQLLAALPAAQAPRSYAILADDLGEPDRAGATFWPRLLGLTWRLSGALAVVLILIGTMQLAGISPGRGGGSPIHPSGTGRGAGQSTGRAWRNGGSGGPASSGASRAARRARRPRRVPRTSVGEAIAVESRAVGGRREGGREGRHRGEGCGRREGRGKASSGGRCCAVTGPDRDTHRHAGPSPTATATIPPTATAAPPTAVPTPAPAALAAAPQREPAGPTFAPGVLWLIGGAVVVVVTGAAWLGERWVRGRQG